MAKVKSLEVLDAVLSQVCADVRGRAENAIEVPERLVVVAGANASVMSPDGVSVLDSGDVVAFANDSGVPFVEQSDHLIAAATELKPEAVLLGGSALTGRSGGAFERVLAVQLFSAQPTIRTARTAGGTRRGPRSLHRASGVRSSPGRGCGPSHPRIVRAGLTLCDRAIEAETRLIEGADEQAAVEKGVECGSSPYVPMAGRVFRAARDV